MLTMSIILLAYSSIFSSFLKLSGLVIRPRIGGGGMAEFEVLHQLQKQKKQKV